jgi:hypothetical protein
MSLNSLGQGVVISLSRNEDMKPVRADELLSRESTAQLECQLRLRSKPAERKEDGKKNVKRNL